MELIRSHVGGLRVGFSYGALSEIDDGNLAFDSVCCVPFVNPTSSHVL